MKVFDIGQAPFSVLFNIIFKTLLHDLPVFININFTYFTVFENEILKFGQTILEYLDLMLNSY